MEIYKTWLELKALLITKKLNLQYYLDGHFYRLWAIENNITYKCDIYIENPKSDDQLDFENNYQNNANQPIIPINDEGKTVILSESRPLNAITSFTCISDDTDIGNGKELKWNFANNDDIISVDSGYPFKRKRIKFKFLDNVNIKEGSIYFANAPFGSYIDLMIICPEGQYYLDNNKNPVLAEEDIIIAHYVRHHFMIDSCPMGDELNTESCSGSIPPYYKFWIDITVPDNCNDCYGFVSLEIYRNRTVIL